jgi:hypothetical protein
LPAALAVEVPVQFCHLAGFFQLSATRADGCGAAAHLPRDRTIGLCRVSFELRYRFG